MGAMSTGTIIALVGGAGVLLYLVMSKSSTTTATGLPAGTVIPTGSSSLAITESNNAAATTGTEVNDASDTVNNLINSIFS
jgi:hypothetical protein